MFINGTTATFHHSLYSHVCRLCLFNVVYGLHRLENIGHTQLENAVQACNALQNAKTQGYTQVLRRKIEKIQIRMKMKDIRIRN